MNKITENIAQKKKRIYKQGFEKLSGVYNDWQGAWGWSAVVLKNKKKMKPFLKMVRIKRDGGRVKLEYNKKIQVPIMQWRRVFGNEGVAMRAINEYYSLKDKGVSK